MFFWDLELQNESKKKMYQSFASSIYRCNDHTCRNTFDNEVDKILSPLHFQIKPMNKKSSKQIICNRLQWWIPNWKLFAKKKQWIIFSRWNPGFSVGTRFWCNTHLSSPMTMRQKNQGMQFVWETNKILPFSNSWSSWTWNNKNLCKNTIIRIESLPEQCLTCFSSTYEKITCNLFSNA